MKTSLLRLFIFILGIWAVGKASAADTALDNELYKITLPGIWQNVPDWPMWVGAHTELVAIEYSRLKGKWPRKMLSELILERLQQAETEIKNIARRSDVTVVDAPQKYHFQPETFIDAITVKMQDGSLRSTYLINRNHVFIRLTVTFTEKSKAEVQSAILEALSNISWREPLNGALEGGS